MSTILPAGWPFATFVLPRTYIRPNKWTLRRIYKITQYPSACENGRPFESGMRPLVLSIMQASYCGSPISRAHNLTRIYKRRFDERRSRNLEEVSKTIRQPGASHPTVRNADRADSLLRTTVGRSCSTAASCARPPRQPAGSAFLRMYSAASPRLSSVSVIFCLCLHLIIRFERVSEFRNWASRHGQHKPRPKRKGPPGTPVQLFLLNK